MLYFHHKTFHPHPLIMSSLIPNHNHPRTNRIPRHQPGDVIRVRLHERLHVRLIHILKHKHPSIDGIKQRPRHNNRTIIIPSLRPREMRLPMRSALLHHPIDVVQREQQVRVRRPPRRRVRHHARAPSRSPPRAHRASETRRTPNRRRRRRRLRARRQRRHARAIDRSIVARSTVSRPRAIDPTRASIARVAHRCATSIGQSRAGRESPLGADHCDRRASSDDLCWRCAYAQMVCIYTPLYAYARVHAGCTPLLYADSANTGDDAPRGGDPGRSLPTVVHGLTTTKAPP
mmetsp:Transcript_7479/g.27304  ORF Transcript_7479/g.27304 Transcript_7479/m.27304 type:complete len:289 (+) Transcript_7479:1748-2614(+)